MKLSNNIIITSEQANTIEKQKIIDSVIKILEANTLLSLATVNTTSKPSQPNSCFVFYVFDDQLRLYFWTDPHAQHSKNIALNSKVAVSIAGTEQKFGSMLRGLQITGCARIIKTTALLHAGGLYFKRFPLVSTFAKHPTQLHAKKLESKIYVVEIDTIKVFDEKTFGKEVYKTLVIKRK